MTPEQFKKAEPLMKVRDSLIDALENATTICNNITDKRINDIKQKNEPEKGLTGGFGIVVSQYADGSGDHMNLSNCYVADEVKFAVKNILENKLNNINTLLNDI